MEHKNPLDDGPTALARTIHAQLCDQSHDIHLTYMASNDPFSTYGDITDILRDASTALYKTFKLGGEYHG